MALNIVLTDEIRSLPYFSDFKEDSVDVPAKPFLRELLGKTLQVEALGIDDLRACVETCIYFALDAGELTQELIWKIGENMATFKRWIIPKRTRMGLYVLNPKLSVTIKAELGKMYGSSFDRSALVKLGIRCLNPSSVEIILTGNLKFLRWSYEAAKNKSSFWNKQACDVAAKKGYLDCLKYAHENGCPWDKKTPSGAAREGHLECLKYLDEQGCPWDSITCRDAAENGHLECLQYAHGHGCPLHVETCLVAAKKGSLNCLKYAHEKGCSLMGVVYLAARKGNLECLKYAYEREGTLYIDLIQHTAADGYLDCLRYMHEQGFPWNEATTLCAASYGHLECLKYAHEQGCPWDKNAYIMAREKRHLACVEYLRENGCPME